MNTPNYKESTISGTKWQRAVRVVIDNPYGSTPYLLFVEEEAFNTGDKVITNLCSNLTVPFDATNQDHVELYQKLNALYVSARNERDNQIQTEVQP